MTKEAGVNTLHPGIFDLDFAAETERIAQRLRETTARLLHKRGLVVAISGGVDSAVCAALAVRAVGAGKVLALILPERDSASASARHASVLAEHLGIHAQTMDIAPTLAAIGCYDARDAAVRRVLPAYADGWRMKIAIAGGREGAINRFRLIAESPAGERHDCDLPLAEYLAIVAATNFKQRVRKTLEYFHADRLNYAVVGTPNRLEYDQGFFVKNGDGAADVKPIAHLYKTQVYALARQLGLPDCVATATPTTDTYSLAQGQDEFYFALPWAQMDLALWALEHARPASELATALGIAEVAAEAIYADIRNKRRSTRYLHLSPVLLDPDKPAEHAT